MDPLLIVMLIVVGIIFVIFVIASAIKQYANRITTWFNLKKLNIDKGINEYTRLLLDENGLDFVEVKVVGWFASLFIGNTYKTSTRTIRLAWITSKRSTVTNLAKACELVGLAKLHNEEVKNIKSVEVNKWFSGLPYLFLPFIIVGLVIDLVSAGNLGMFSIIFSGVGLVLTLFSFIMSIISVGVAKKALKSGQEIILSMGLLDEKEEGKIKKLFSAWKNLYVINAIFAVFEVLYFVIKIIGSTIKIGRK